MPQNYSHMEQDSTEKTGSLKLYALKKGVLLGIGVSTLVTLVYMIDFSFMIHWSFSVSVLIILLMLVVIFGNQYRASGDGYLTFGKAFQLSFIMLIISYSCQLVFNILLYNVIDPDLPDLIAEAAVTNSEELLRSFGMPQDQIDQQTLRLEKEMPEQFTIFGQLKNSWIMVILSFVFALITGAIVKRNEPVINN